MDLITDLETMIFDDNEVENKTDIQGLIADLWFEALDLSPNTTNKDKNFFELGGYSLLAVQLASKISEVTQFECSPNDILRYDRLDDLIYHLENNPNQINENIGKKIKSSGNQIKKFPLTELQQAYWLGENQNYELGGSATWFTEYSTDTYDHARFQDAMDELVKRHPTLRTVFDDEAYQCVLENVPNFPIEYEDLSKHSEVERTEKLNKIREKVRDNNTGLDKWPLMSVAIIKTKNNYRVLMSGRLIIMDGKSADIFANDLWNLYQNKSLPKLELTFKDYLLFLDNMNSDSEDIAHAAAEKYWAERLSNLPSGPELPKSVEHENKISPMRRLSVSLEAESWKNFKNNASINGVTPTVAICTAFSYVLSLWSGKSEFVLNIMYGNRQPYHKDINSIIGCLSQTLLLEVKLNQGGFSDSSRNIQKQLFADMEHWRKSGIDVLRDLAALQGNTSGKPLMPIVFASGLGLDDGKDIDETPFFMEKFGWESIDSGIQTPHVLLDHQVAENRGALIAQWDVRDDLLDMNIANDMFDTYSLLLHELSKTNTDMWQKIRPVDIPPHQKNVRNEVNDTYKSFDNKKLVHESFIESVKKFPSNVALISEEQAWTYTELLAWSNTIYESLKASNNKQGDLVGIYMSKGAAQVAGALGILFSDCVYVPLSMDTPVRRLEGIISQCNIKTVLVDESCDDTEIKEYVSTIRVSTKKVDKTTSLDLSKKFKSKPSDLAYIIFTSGTTGIPKGVAITHESVMNTLVDINDRFSVTDEDKVLGVSELNFDLSVYDIFGAFIAGACLVLPENENTKNPIHLVDQIKKHKISVWNSVPAFLEMIVEYCEFRDPDAIKSLKKAYVSGDWVPLKLHERLNQLNEGCELISMGGATEASIWSNYHKVTHVEDSWKSIPYGKPLSNQYFCVLDSLLNDSPNLVPGELYIGGKGLAKCYYRDEDRTRDQFITHPISEQRLYKTGDWGRYHEDGVLEFLGRKDTQVKIRGHRIELGDIDSALARIDNVRDAVSIIRYVNNVSSDIYAFVSVTNSNVTESSLLEKISDEIPPYMIPKKILIIEGFPLSANGKVDRKSLEKMITQEDKNKPIEVKPTTRMQVLISDVWKEMLSINNIYIDDNFFEIGGNSITVIRMLNKLSDLTNKRVDVTLGYTHQSIRALSEELDNMREPEANTPLIPIKTGGSGKTLFCIHPIGGSVFCYRDLAKLWSGDVYGLQSLGTNPEYKAHNNIIQMAKYYIDLIVEHKPIGEIHILGWSMGGMIAAEMSRQLSKIGRKVKVVLLDTWVPKKHTSFDEHSIESDIMGFFYDLSNGVELDQSIFENATPKESMRKGMESLNTKNVDINLDESILENLFNVYTNNSKAISAHAPYTSKSDMLLFVANLEKDTRFSQLKKLSSSHEWLSAYPNIEIKSIKANHFTIVTNDVLEEIIHHINEFYEK